MTNEQVNNLVISYQEDEEESVFTELFEVVSKYWESNKVFYSLARKHNVEVVEVESMANILVYETVKKYEPTGNYLNFLAVALSRKCSNLRRDTAKYFENETSLEETLGDDEDGSSLADFIITESNIEYERKKDDQCQLIAQLLDEAPDKSRQALKAYVESDYSFPKAAKLLGISYPAVKRRIEKLATYFDANQNGSINEYYTTATA